MDTHRATTINYGIHQIFYNSNSNSFFMWADPPFFDGTRQCIPASTLQLLMLDSNETDRRECHFDGDCDGEN